MKWGQNTRLDFSLKLFFLDQFFPRFFSNLSSHLSLGLDDAEPAAVVFPLDGDVATGLNDGLLLVLPAPHLLRDGLANVLNVPGVGPAHTDRPDHLDVVTDDPGFAWNNHHTLIKLSPL